MPLTLYPRAGHWWIRGRIDRIPAGRYYRQSLGAPVEVPETEARQILANFEAKEIKRHLIGEPANLTFGEAVLLYDAPPADAGYLALIVPVLSETFVGTITPVQVKKLARDLYPHASTDTWQRQVLTPVRSVINNAHALGKGPPIRIAGFTKAERIKQDQSRGKRSRAQKTPGSWVWIDAFAAKAPARLAALARFMFTTGARIGQAVLINDTTDLDLQNGRVLLPAAKGHEAQWIDLIPEVVADLANLTPRSGRLFGYQHRWGVYKGWRKVCKNAGIDYIAPHAAGRHGFGTELIVRHGIDAVTVASEGRWANPKVPLETYAHAEDSTARVHAVFRTKRVQNDARSPTKPRKRKTK